MPLNVILLIFFTTAVRLFLSSLFPLTADESYYWLWAKHLDLSYVDHPPMVAYINFLTTFGKENLFTQRLGAAMITMLVGILIYKLAQEVFNERVAFWSVVLFQVLPHFLVVWLTMFVELPFALFWAASLFILCRIVKTKNARLWYWLALTLGLGYLSKYTMFLFWPCLALFFLLSPENRFWLKQKEVYLALFFSLLFFAPVVYWNGAHGWASFAFHGAKLGSNAWGANTLAFLADQLVHFTPFLIFSLYGISKFSLKKGDSSSRLLFCFSVPVLLLFAVLSLKVKIWAHWPSIGYLAALPLAVNYLIENKKSLAKFMVWTGLFSGLVLAILFWVSPGILLHQKDYAGNSGFAQALPKDYKIFARTNVSASLLEFYARRQTYMATGFLKPWPLWGEKQYELWGIPGLSQGETVIYYGEDIRDAAEKYFERITELPEIKLHLIEDYISNNYRMFKLEGFKGAGHP